MDKNRDQMTARPRQQRDPRKGGVERRPVQAPPVDERGPVQQARDIVTDGADTVGGMVGGIIEDLQGIVRGEVQLAKTEMKEEAGRMGKGAGMIGAGVFFALVAFIFLMLALTYLLTKWFDMWVSAGIVGLGLLVIAAILAMMGKSQIDNANLAPEKTIDSLKEDKEWASRQMNSVKK